MAKISVGDIRIAVSDVGEGPPIVLLHGMACGKRMWFHQVRALRNRFRVITFDQRGHGDTDAPDDPACYSAGHLARDLIGVLDALDIPKAHILGFSLGGGPALSVAASAPDRVSRLVLADIGAGADDPWKSDWLARRWTTFARQADDSELIADMLRSDFYKHYANRGARYRCHMAGLIRATPIAALRHILTEIIAKRKSLFRMKSTLAAIRAPTLIMLGQHDYVCRNATRLLAESISGAALKTIKNAGHMSPLEAPRLFSDNLLAFLTAS